jgi:hypothetical protein
VEAAISRYKRVIGDVLRSHTDGRQATEVAIAVGVLNRMSELGHPESVRSFAATMSEYIAAAHSSPWSNPANSQALRPSAAAGLF